jgi:hypothetical protein
VRTRLAVGRVIVYKSGGGGGGEDRGTLLLANLS